MALAACAATPPGGEAPRRHPTIVSLNPCSDAVLAEVADPAQILALSNFSSSAASSSMDVALARRFRAVSDSAEEVLALAPDVVIAGSFLSPAMISALRRTGVRLVQIPIATSVAASEAQVRAIAGIAGRPERGEALVVRIEAALAEAAPPPDSRPIAAVVWQSGGLVPGDVTLIADLLRRTGFANFSGARGMRQADYLPLETMLADPPQVILAAGNARSQEDRLLRHPALAALTETRRAALDPSLLWCGGPTIVRAAERLGQVRRGVAARHPRDAR
ncbi:MAG: ABC transporter substrate-binding protein [Novosphingobium sp.]